MPGPVEFRAEGLEIEKNQGRDLLPADSVVIAAESFSKNRLMADIGSLVPEVYTVGDAKKPCNALEAVKEGFFTGLRIE